MRKVVWIVGCVVLIGLITYFLRQYILSSSVNDKEIDKTVLSDWNIFSDGKINFSLKYPKNDWSVSFDDKLNSILYLKNHLSEKPYSIEIISLKNTTINDAIENDSIIRLTNGESKRTDFYIDGKETAKIEGTYNQEGVENQEYVNAFIQNGKDIIKIILMDKIDEEIYNQIITTIKFTN